MFVSEILFATRNDYLHDLGDADGRGKLWGDEELLRHLIKALNELCRETGVIRDTTTAAITQIPILANQHTYPMDPRITEIHNPAYGIYYDPTTGKYKDQPVLVKDDTWIDRNLMHWKIETGDVRYLLPDYDTNNLRVIRYPGTDKGYWSGAFTFVSGTKTIGQTGTDFSKLVAGNQVVISGTSLNGTTASPKTFTVVTVSTGSFTVSEAVANETASAGIIQKVIFILYLTVSRLPLNQLTIAGVETQSPEIKADYHFYLIDGILRDAYLKQDTQCLDKEKASTHRAIFEQNKRKVKAARDWLRNSEEIAVPHRGAL